MYRFDVWIWFIVVQSRQTAALLGNPGIKDFQGSASVATYPRKQVFHRSDIHGWHDITWEHFGGLSDMADNRPASWQSLAGTTI